MASIQERLQRKREPLDTWSIREQLCLSFAVAKVGDQNWMSVSRSLKPFGDGRPADWFHQKNCAAQYGALLENIDTPKRKKRSSGVDALESPADLILKKLIQERLLEIKKLLEEEKAEYKQLQDDMIFLKSGAATEEELDAMCKQIDEEEQQKENEALAHAQWLKEREARKAELERVWRPTVKISSANNVAGLKRKASESLDQLIQDAEETLMKNPPDSSVKAPALSPLLTSLLKSPAHAQNVTTSSILHSAITNTTRTTITTPTIASLLNSSASVHVSPGIQQLVTSAIAQEPPQSSKHPIAELLAGADTLPNLKVEDIEDTILSVGGDLAEIKNEEVDVIISDLIEKHSHIVTDPETHLLDGDDIISNFENELEELDNKEKAEREEREEMDVQSVEIKEETASEMPVVKDVQVDPFEFQEDDPEVEVKLPRSIGIAQPATTSDVASNDDDDGEEEEEEIVEEAPVEVKEEMIDMDVIDEEEKPPAVAVDEVSAEAEPDKQQPVINEEVLNEKFMENIEIKEEPIENEPAKDIVADSINETTETGNDAEVEPELSKVEAITTTPKEDASEDADIPHRRDTFTPEYSEPSLFDENIEVTKMDKIGKIKRDYSRTKKREEPDLDLLLGVNDEAESGSEQEESKKPETEVSVKIEAEQSHSPWTESEEPEVHSEQETRPQTRRHSTPATPIDSVPNSPASSHIEDDRDYRSWKKSVMLVYSRLANHKYASLFLKPITNEHAPGYHQYIKRPMDLATIKKNIESGAIRTTAEFKRDLLLMFCNAIMFNKTDDIVYKMAHDMQQEAVEQLRMLVQAQSDCLVFPARRETRTSELGIGSKRKRDSDSLQVHHKSKKRREDF